MALSKAVKVGGSYYKGYKLQVSSSVGDYSLIITNTGGAALNGMAITPDTYGSGDTFSIQHRVGSAGTGNIIQILAEEVYNMGAFAPTLLDFPSLQLVGSTEAIKLIYTNVATKALNVYVVGEWIGITKTG